MNAFLSGATGALVVLSLAGLTRRAMWHRFGGRRRLGVRRMLRRIGARPEQERAVAAETDALVDAFFALRGDARALRADLAELIAAPSVDAERVAAAIDARFTKAAELRGRFAGAVSRIHAALDPAQRLALADLVRSGPRGAGCGRRPWAHA
jgi:hypothetical protein